MGNKRLDSDGCPKYCCPQYHWLTVTINYKHFALGFASKLIILNSWTINRILIICYKKKDLFDIAARCMKYGFDTQAR